MNELAYERGVNGLPVARRGAGNIVTMPVMHRMGQVTCNCKLDQKGRGCQCDRPMPHVPRVMCAPVLYLPRPSRAGIIRRVFEMFEIIKNAVDRGASLDSEFISRRFEFDVRNISRNSRRNTSNAICILTCIEITSRRMQIRVFVANLLIRRDSRFRFGER